jgi:hypothetical protein
MAPRERNVEGRNGEVLTAIGPVCAIADEVEKGLRTVHSRCLD